jgi:hypothetical protein
MSFQCPNCGTGLEGTERFCRKCGSRILPEDLHEAATRSFDDAPLPLPQQTPVDPLQSSGAESTPMTPRQTQVAGYVPPHYGVPTGGVPPGVPAYPPMSAPATGSLRKPRNWKVIFGVIFMSLVLFCGTGGFLFYSAWSSVAERISVGEDGEVTVDTGDGEIMWQAPSVDKLPADIRDWVYPGATVRTFVRNTSGGEDRERVLVLTTKDDTAKVTEFYRKRLPEKGDRQEHSTDDGTSIISEGVVINIQKHSPFGDATMINVVFDKSIDAGEGPEMGPEDMPSPPGGRPPLVPHPPPPPPPGR